MATSALQYFHGFLPEIKISPVPEHIFLFTIKALFVPATSLSLSQWGAVAALILLTNSFHTLRQTTLQLYGYLSLIVGAEIAFINSYVLVSASWHPLQVPTESRQGLLMDFSIDNASTSDHSYIERAEQHYSHIYGLGHPLSPREGEGVPVQVANRTRRHDGHAGLSQVCAPRQRGVVRPCQRTIY